VIVLVPAYEPDARLVDLVDALSRVPEVDGIVVVDDGSGPDHREVFSAAEARGAEVVVSATNEGKGSALKHGFAWIAEHHPGHVVVCADCDGQHLPEDVVRVGRDAAEQPDTIVLGVRRFTGRVPLKSRFGNNLTRALFAVSTGRRVSDTQTGLRAYHPSMLPWLAEVPGRRFEYELEVLLRSGDAGLSVKEVPIATVYLDGNESTHFRPVVDSLRVYAPLVRFCASSVSAFLVDVVVLQLLYLATDHLAVSVVGARVASSTFNFAVNRRFVFGGADSTRSISAMQYFSLVLAILFANYWSMHLWYIVVGLPLLVAKVVTELALFTVSYQVQKRFIFRRGREASTTEARRPRRSRGGVVAVVMALLLAAAVAGSPDRTASAASSPVVEQAWTHSDADVDIVVTRISEGSGSTEVTYFVADLTLRDTTRLRGGFASDTGRTRTTPAAMARANGAIFAVSGDYFGYRRSGVVVRNGTVVREGGSRAGLLIMRNGRIRVNRNPTSARILAARGVWHTASFGPPLVESGKVSRRINEASSYLKQRHPRSGVCMRSPGNLTFIVVDGRRAGHSRGMNLREFANLFRSRGCRTAYNLDGGRTATMYFAGSVLNRPAGGQRNISDIFFVAAPPT
jgi:exopolysaccharide biosynthesis protein/putative flippase GtrA